MRLLRIKAKERRLAYPYCCIALKLALFQQSFVSTVQNRYLYFTGLILRPLLLLLRTRKVFSPYCSLSSLFLLKRVNGSLEPNFSLITHAHVFAYSSFLSRVFCFRVNQSPRQGLPNTSGRSCSRQVQKTRRSRTLPTPFTGWIISLLTAYRI